MGSKAWNAMQCEDRFSNLPNNLIGRILSSLPTKTTVATSILSTRWKQVWTLVTSLDFDDKLLQDHQTSNRAAHQMSFVSFVDKVLERVSYVKKFHLKCCQSYDAFHANAWVAAVIKYRIEELDLSVPVKHSTDHVLPQDLYSCKTLVVLKLGTKFMLNVPASVCLSRLKIFHLDGVKFSDDESIKRLLVGCPMLDELGMNECVGKDVNVVHISAPVLTKLRYHKHKEKDRYSWRKYYKIVIDTPALLYLELIDYAAKVFLVKNLRNIVKADISLSVEFSKKRFKAITDLLMGISEVQCLHLYNERLVDPRNINSELPIFHNLTSLVLGAGYVGWEWLSQLLAKSPCLESLVFKEEDHINSDSDGSEYEYGYEYEHEYNDEDDSEGNVKDEPWNCNPPQNVPSCFLSDLKVIKFVNFRGGNGGMKMVEYFLRNVEVLEKLIIHTDGTLRQSYNTTDAALTIAKQKLEITKKLLMLPRASKVCQIEFVILRHDLNVT